MGSKTFNLDQFKSMLRDPTFIPFLMIWITHGIGGWGITFVLPTVIYELGISNTAIAQVMTMVSTPIFRRSRASNINKNSLPILWYLSF